MKNSNSMFKATAMRVALVLGVSALALNGCKNPAEDIKVAIATESLSKAPTLIKFVKASATAAALPATINVTIGGTGKDLVQTDNGGKDFVASNGILPISLNRFANPTEAAPVEFTISANVNGYAPVFKKVLIKNAKDLTNIEIPLLSYNAPAEGTAVVQTEKALTNGVSVAETKIETAASTATPQSVDLTIAAGTQVQDANKQPIAASSVKSTVVYFGTNDADGLKAVAPILTAVNPIGPNNQPITGEVSFITAGAVSINMTAGTTDVKNFSKAITAEIEINPALINPTTNVAVKAGDVIPVWSLNEGNGQWTYEGTTTIANVGGKLVATINITHLSTWALNWYNSAAACDVSVEATLGADISAYVGYSIVLESKSGQPMGTIIRDIPTLSDQFLSIVSKTLTRARILPGKIVAYDAKNVKVAEVDLASCGTFKINIPAPAFTDFVDANINFVARCTNKNIIAYPTTFVVLKDITDGTESDVHMVNGKINLKLKNGHTYAVSAVYDEKTYTSENIVIDRTKSVNVSNASGLKVVGSYSTSTKIMTLDADMTVSDCK